MIKIPRKVLNISAIVCWIVSFILSCTVPPASPFIWLADTLLLIGFWPLLISMKARWLWLVFGICNVFIGFVLLVAIYLPEAELAKYHLLAVNTHMKLYHSYLAWLIIGILSTIVALVILTTSLAVWLSRYRNKTIKNQN